MARALLKHLAEIFLICEADHLGDFGNFEIRISEHDFRLIHAEPDDVIANANLKLLAEQTGQIIGA